MKTTKGIVCGLAFNGSLEAFTFIHFPVLPPIGGIIGTVTPRVAYYKVINILLVGDELTPERVEEMERQASETGEPQSALRDYALLFVEHYNPDDGLEKGSSPIPEL